MVFRIGLKESRVTNKLTLDGRLEESTHSLLGDGGKEPEHGDIATEVVTDLQTLGDSRRLQDQAEVEFDFGTSRHPAYPVPASS